MRRIAIVGLAAILIAYLGLVQRRTAPAWFGYYHDDSLYWTAAESLARGDGYRMASVPGAPEQTKYPVGFPWLLSWVWRFAPEFPANLAAAVWLVAASGAAFLAGSFVLLRQLGLGESAALALTAVCALHPVVIHLGGLLLSDVPFMALMVWSLVLAGWALEGKTASRGFALWAGALMLAVLACLVRTIGIPLLAGLAAATLWRRSYRPALACLAVAVLMLAATLGRGTRSPGPVTDEGPFLAENKAGYEQTMEFYRSYAGFWKRSNPDWPTVAALLSFNLQETLKQPAISVFSIPAAGFAPIGWQLAAVALSFTVVKGMGSLAVAGRHPAFVALGLYTVAVLLWNYALGDRFFAWALPLFLAGAWREIGGLAHSTRETFRRRAGWVDRGVAVAVMGALAAVGVYGGYRSLWVVPQAMAEKLVDREGLQQEKLMAYAWIRQNTAAQERFIASEDASLYLYTGRQALRPMAFSTAAFYLQSQAALDGDLERMGDTACAIGARYWLAAADDYHLESAEEFIAKRAGELLAGRPKVFTSSGGRVQIYDLEAATAPGAGRCGRTANPSVG